MSKKIEILARGVLVQNGRVLLCHTKGAANTYLPGGHVEFKESARAALCREIKEEMGLDSTAGRFLGAVEHSFVQKGKPHCEVNLLFELTVPGLDETSCPPSEEDYIEFCWGELTSLRGAALEPSVLCTLLSDWIHSDFAGDRWATGGDFMS